MLHKVVRIAADIILHTVPYCMPLIFASALIGCFMDPRIDPMSVGVGFVFGLGLSYYLVVCVQHNKLFEKILKSDQEIAPDEE